FRISATTRLETGISQGPARVYRRRSIGKDADRKLERGIRYASQMIPNFAAWQWALGAFSALAIGIAKTGMPGLGSFVAPLMVLTVGDARHAAGWTLPILSTADIFAVLYWRKHADARKLFSLIPWVVAGMVGGAIALSLPEHVLRRMIGCVIVLMLVVYVVRRSNPQRQVAGSPSF